MHIEIRARPIERLHQECLPFLSELSRVVLARSVNQARDEALERIATHKEPKTLPIAEMKNSGRDPQQLLFGRLEQLIARIRIKNVDQRFFGVPAGRQMRAPDHVRRLVPQERDVGRLRAIRCRCE